MNNSISHPFFPTFEAHVKHLDSPALFRLAEECTQSLEDIIRQGFEAVNEGFNPEEGTKPIVLIREKLLPVFAAQMESDCGSGELDLGEPKIVFDFFKSEHPVDLSIKAIQDKLLQAGNDEAMKVYTAFTNTLEKTIHGGLSAGDPLLFKPQDPAETLYVVFAGMVCFPEFKKSLEQLGNIDQLHILDPNRSWYMQGPEGEWNGYEYYHEVLQRNLDALKAETSYKRVCFLGNSMGASAACLFSEHADAVLAFCPQTEIPSDNVPGEVKERYKRLMTENLSTSLAAGKVISIHRGVSANDIMHCERLPPGIDPLVHEGCAVHNLPGFLKSEGILLDVLGSIR